MQARVTVALRTTEVLLSLGLLVAFFSVRDLPLVSRLPAFYSVEKGGSPGYSFAMYSTSVVRFRPGVTVTMGSGEEWVPEGFDAAREADDYDYFIVKSSIDRTSSLFAGAQPAAVLDQHVGDWWGYRRVPRAEARF